MFDTEAWGWPQDVYIIANSISVIHSFYAAGEKKTQTPFLLMLISEAAWIFIYYKGGFFDTMHAPQIIYIILAIIGAIYAIDREESTYDPVSTTIATGLFTLLLGWGGFFN